LYQSGDDRHGTVDGSQDVEGERIALRVLEFESACRASRVSLQEGCTLGSRLSETR